ncbi:MAG: hypothetical protein ABIS16_00685 [Sphingomicrobium sp.]
MADFYPALSYHELIGRICLEAGRIMEDTSAELASFLPTGTAVVEKRLSMLRQASLDIATYSAAADALHRRANHGDPVS